MARLISFPTPTAEPCLWGEECDRMAVAIRVHPILGEMPACQAHAEMDGAILWGDTDPPRLHAL